MSVLKLTVEGKIELTMECNCAYICELHNPTNKLLPKDAEGFRNKNLIDQTCFLNECLHLNLMNCTIFRGSEIEIEVRRYRALDI